MEYIANVPVVSKTPSIPSKDAVDPRVVFLLPPASTPEKRSDFQNTLAQSGIHSDLIVNRGIEMRNETVYSFSGMAEELLQLLKHVRSEYTGRLVVGATCLATVSLGKIISEIISKNLVDGIIGGVPVSSLLTVKTAHNISTENLLNAYKQKYHVSDLFIDRNDLRPNMSVGLIESLKDTLEYKKCPYKPFLYFNHASKYIDKDTKNDYFSLVGKGKLDGIVLDPVFDAHPQNMYHDIQPEDLPIIKKMTIAYIKGS